MKYIFITGGVVSGLGKGITAASLGRLLKDRGVEVRLQKFDPYLNINPGIMSPIQHGEVFVTDDGAEADIDVGHYERFIDENLDIHADVTAGQIYWKVLNQEREGKFNGGTVQVIPHITNEIKNCIRAGAKKDTQVVITEIGGTVGDIESQPFLEAARQLAAEEGHANVLFIHVSLIVHLASSDELKSKPTQHSVKELLSIGISPNIIVCRSDIPIPADIRSKIALFCNVAPDCVIENSTADTLYEVPLLLEKEGLDTVVCRLLNIDAPPAKLTSWRKMIADTKACDQIVNIGLVGKYTALQDAYLSVGEALRHAGVANNVKVKIHWISAEDVTAESAPHLFRGIDGILVPYGFGPRGMEGKQCAARYAREHDIPLLCNSIGMEMAIVDFARSVCGLTDANSTELDTATTCPVIHTVPIDEHSTVAPMRLGLHECKLKSGTLAHKLYSQSMTAERHRHRYEVNPAYREVLEQNGMVFSGLSPDGNVLEMMELPDRKFYIGTQGLPEFRSRPNRPHPLYVGFVAAAKDNAAE